jgi:hypothetical protein
MHVHFEWPMCEVKKVHVCAVYNDINDITSTQSSFDIVQIYSPNEKSLRECHWDERSLVAIIFIAHPCVNDTCSLYLILSITILQRE